MMFRLLVIVLAVVCKPAYTAPTLDCSQTGAPNELFKTVNDTLDKSDELFHTNVNISFSNDCNSKSILNITSSGQGKFTVSLNKELKSYCLQKLDCKFNCSGNSPELRILADIKRTQNYTMSFTARNITASVFENSENGSQIDIKPNLEFTVEECENSSGIFPQYRRNYRLLPTNKPEPFYWRAQTIPNDLHLNGTLDFEKKKMYEVIIEATLETNSGEPLHGSATTTLTVYVDDVDDNNPRFNISQNDKYKLWIPEQNPSYNHTWLSTTPPVQAYDPDFGINMTVHYEIKEQQINDLFQIDTENGSTRVTKVLDCEEQQEYIVYIKAYQIDKKQVATAETRIVIYVNDTDDNLPKFPKTNYQCSVSEHSVNGTDVCSVTAIDKDTNPENRNFTYKLWDYETFLSVSKDGHIRVVNSAMFDRETLGSNITFEVGTSTGGGILGGNTTVTITLIDINDNNPKFSEENYSFGIVDTDKGSHVGQVNASDLDEGPNAEIFYKMLPSVFSSDCLGNLPKTPLFAINSSTGEITIAADEATLCKQHVLHVKACDNGVTSRCTIAMVKIISATPKVRHYTQQASVLEELPVGTAVDILKCNGPNNEYSNVSIPEFKVDNSTGMLRTSEVLDRETQDSYNFEVNVTNASGHDLSYFLTFTRPGGGDNTTMHKSSTKRKRIIRYVWIFSAVVDGELFCIVNISVNVDDVNDNTPKFINTSFKFYLPSNLKDGDTVDTIVAEDKDLGDNGNVSYYLESQSSPFELDRISGLLTIKDIQLLNEDITQAFVTAEDNGVPKRKQSTIFYIIGNAQGNTVPISTPLAVENIQGRQQELERKISDILSIPVKISLVEDVVNKTSQSKSRLHLSLARNSTSSQHFLSQVLHHYEDIRSLFFKAKENTETNKHSKSAVGPSEIGLIVMAGVILAGAIIAIIIVHRQFNSHKRYKQLYETLTKNSSLYESQEITVNIGDGDGELESTGTVRSRDIEVEEDPSPVISALNPVYQSETTLTPSTGPTQEEEDSTASLQNESTDVKEVLHQLSESYEQDVNDSERVTDQSESSGVEMEQSVFYANVVKGAEVSAINDDGDTDTAYAQSDTQNALEGGPGEGSTINNNDLITFDSESNNVANGQWDNESETSAPDNEIEEEPQPDYNQKQVRFHTEVLDAGENKIEPLKVKNEEGSELNESVETDTNAARYDSPYENLRIGNTSGPDLASEKSDNADEIDPMSVEENADSLEEEVDSSEVNVPYVEQIRDEFFNGDVQSTQF